MGQNQGGVIIVTMVTAIAKIDAVIEAVLRMTAAVLLLILLSTSITVTDILQNV